MEKLNEIITLFALTSFASSNEIKNPSHASDLASQTIVPAEMISLADDHLEVTVWAKSPMIQNPTNMDFDAAGRLYVTEGVNYRKENATKRPEGDRVIVLEDTNKDGAADSVKTFLQDKNLECPLGVAVFGNQVVVSQPPDLLVYTDVDLDGIFNPSVDRKETLLTGFNGRQHDHSLHSVTAGPDGQWNFNFGNCGAIFTDRSNKTFRAGSGYYMSGGGTWYFDTNAIAGQASDDGNVWIGGASVRMNPDGTHARIVGHNYRNSYEQSITSFGDMFQSDNDDPPACRVTEVIEGGNAGFFSEDGQRSWLGESRPGQDTPTAHWRQEDPGTMPVGDVYGGGSPTGVAFYENGALGKKWEGLLLACEAGRNVIFGYLPEAQGAGFKLARMDFIDSNKEKKYEGFDYLILENQKPGTEFTRNVEGAQSTQVNTLFRPSDICVGPDGALYVADWFDPVVGGHSTIDASASGTIYRIAPKGFKSVIPKIDLTTTEGQILALQSPAVNVRHSGFVRLKAQGEKAIPAVAELLSNENRYIAARAVWLLAQLGAQGKDQVIELLNSSDDRTRLVACRALRAAAYDVLELAKKMAVDPAPMVRREIALSLRNAPIEKSLPYLVAIGKMFDGHDRAYLDAFGIGSSGNEVAVYQALKAEMLQNRGDTWSDAFAWIAWRLHPNQAVNDQKLRALSPKVSEEQVKLTLTALGFTETLQAASAMAEIATHQDFAQKDLANWWLNHRKNNLWKSFDVDGILATYGKKTELVKLVAVPMPASMDSNPPLAAVEDIAKLTGDPEKGKLAITTCYMCHQIQGQGVSFGPDLSSYGKQQTKEVIIKGIAHPSAAVSHGYEGTEIITKDGLVITGILLSDADPVMIKTMGGTNQIVPRSDIRTIEPMKRSLMYDPGNLNLTAQQIADITAYLKSL